MIDVVTHYYGIDPLGSGDDGLTVTDFYEKLEHLPMIRRWNNNQPFDEKEALIQQATEAWRQGPVPFAKACGILRRAGHADIIDMIGKDKETELENKKQWNNLFGKQTGNREVDELVARKTEQLRLTSTLAQVGSFGGMG